MLWFTGVTSNHTGTHKETPVKQFAAATLPILVLAGCRRHQDGHLDDGVVVSRVDGDLQRDCIRLYGQRVGRHDRAVLV
jgi:hypothetical protein